MIKENYETIEKILKDKNKKQLKELIFILLNENNYEEVLLWANKFNDNEIKIKDKLVLEYWNKTKKLIKALQEDIEDHFYDQGYDYYDKCEFEDNQIYLFNQFESLIAKIIELKEETSWKTSQQIVKEIIMEYDNDHGFSSHNDYKYSIDNVLVDTCYNLCDNNEKLEFLVEEFLKYKDKYSDIIANIYQKTGNESYYLENKLKSLDNAYDYYELVEFYKNKNDLENALKYAYLGLEKKNYGVNEIINFLFDYYKEKNNSAEIEKLMLNCETLEIESLELVNNIFTFYKQNNDYDNAKRYIIKIFDYVYKDRLDEQYIKIKNFLNKKDWNEIKDKLILEAKKKSKKAYLEICLIENNDKEVYECIMNKSKYYYDDENNYFAKKIINAYPEEISSYFLNEVFRLIEIKPTNRKYYIEAKDYLYYIRLAYKDILKDEKRWEVLIFKIRNDYAKRPTLIKVFSEL